MSKLEYSPTVMGAVILDQTGNREKLQIKTCPQPSPEDGQVVVRNSFAGVNFMDIYLRTGTYPSPVGYPLILGQEGVGTVVTVQGSNPFQFQPGDRVVWIGSAGYAQYTAVNQGQVVRIPDGVADQDAVASHLTGMTALSLIEEAYPVRQGDTVLVHAAAGAVGLLLCQLLKAEGVKVIATAGGPEKCSLVKEFGAAHAIDYRASSDGAWTNQVMELTHGKGVDAVFDSVGKDTWKESIQVTKLKGTVVFFGSASGPVPLLDLVLIRAKNLKVIQPTLPNYIGTREAYEYYAQKVLSKVQSGSLKIMTPKLYDWKEVGRAHQDLEERKSVGKLLLKL